MVYVIAASALTGIQAILPALPAIQSHFALSDSQVSLVTSAYLLPGALFAIPFGILADRMGRRRVMALSLLVFGVSGLAITFAVETFQSLIIWRVIQGVGFAAILPLTITLIGDIHTGARQIAGQGHRSIAMFSSETAYPLIGAALVAVSWSTPFILQSVAIPLALVAWFVLPDVTGKGTGAPPRSKGLLKVLGRSDVLALGGLTFARFFFKFGFLTYLPILLVTTRGMSEAFAGVALSIFAVAGLVAAAFAGRLARHGTSSGWLAISSLVFGVALMSLAANTGPAGALLVVALFGLADGVYGVYLNGVTASMTMASLRASFVSVSGTVRNSAKFLAPSALALLVLRMRLDMAFLVFGIGSLAVTPLALILGRAAAPTAEAA